MGAVRSFQFLWAVGLWLVIALPCFGESTVTLEELRQREAELATLYQALDPFRPQVALPELERRWNALSAEERSAALKGSVAEDGTAGAALGEYMGRMEAALIQFQYAYDAYNDQKFDYLIDRYREFVGEVLKEAPSRLSAPDVAALTELHQQMEGHYKTYYGSKGNLGTRSDRPRGQSFRRFLWTMDDFLDKAGKGFRTWPERLVRQWDRIADPLQFRGASPLRFVPATAAALPSLPSLYSSLRRGNGILEAVGPAVDRLSAFGGASMRMHGLENVSPTAPEGTLNVYAGMHPHSLYDLLAISKLGVKKPIILTALAPDLIREHLIRSNEFIVVGQEGENPAKRIAELVREGKGDSVIIYPEGMMNLWGYETRPPQKNFPLLLKLLRKEGLKISVIPFSQPDSFQMNQTQGPGTGPLDTRRMNTYVDAPISPELVELLLAQGKGAVLSRVLRQTWIDTAHEKGAVKFPRVAGMPGVDAWVPAFDRLKADAAHCEVWFGRLRNQNFRSTTMPRGSTF